MALNQTPVNLPYYELEVFWSGDGGSSRVLLTSDNVDGSPNGGPAPDDVADALRDWFVARSGYQSHTLRKIESTTTNL